MSFTSLTKAVVILAIVMTGLLAPYFSPANAAPWWWTQFTVGDDEFDNSSNYERWMAQYVTSANADEDVWLGSYTWGTGNNGPVNGIFGDNEEGGINRVFLRREGNPDAGPVRVLGDGDNRRILENAVDGLPIELSPRNENLDGFEGRSHHKAIMLGDRSLMVGSANMTAGAFSSQPNNMTVFRNMPELNKAFRREFEEQFSGTHFDNSESKKNHFTSPAGDRVSAYFAPDDNFNISLPSGESGLKLDDVVEKHTSEASESVHYLFNVMYLGDLSNTLRNASGNKLVEGAVDNGADGIIDNLRSDHTSRDGNSFYDGEMHHKLMIFDQEIVAFGSANHTRSAMFRTIGDRNEENLVVVHDFRMGRRYMQEYRRVMSRLDEENEGQPDSFDGTAPGSPSNLVVENDADASNSLDVSWDPPQATDDFSRYYVFVADYELNSAQDIGDGVDNDGDGLIDEDPVGNADGFASGPSSSSLNPNDDDADGRIDEDPWLAPEKQIKVNDPSAVTSTTLETFNVEETLPNNKDLWVGLVAVDKHGNESDPVFKGPVRSFDGGANITPTVEGLSFADGASDEAGETSTLNLDLNNDASSSEAITELTVDFGSGDSAFVTREQTESPDGFSVSRTSSTLTYTADGGGLSPGSSVSLTIDVTNPSDSGTSGLITVDAVDESGNTVEDVEAGTLEVAGAPLREGEGNAIEQLTASASGKSISRLDGSKQLGTPPYEISVRLEREPDTGVTLFWDAGSSPDGPGGSSTDVGIDMTGSGGDFTASISDTDELTDGTSLEFFIYVDGEQFDRSGSPFGFTIDRSVGSPGLNEVLSVGFESVDLGIDGIGDGDFKEYRGYFSKDGSVSTDDSFQRFTERDVSSLTVNNLDPSSSYEFAVTAVDQENNESSLSNTLSASTRRTVGLDRVVVENSDGSQTADQLDGSEAFREEPLTVQMEFDTAVSGGVRVFYDVGDNPDGPGGSNTEERSVEANGSGAIWEAGIPSDDSEIEPGATLKFIIVTDDRVIRNDGVAFQYKYRETPPTVSGLAVEDTGGGRVTLDWSPVTDFLDFAHYRVFYERGSDTPTANSLSWGPSNEGALTLDSTGKTTVENLAPNAQYRFRVGIVDEFGRVGPLSATLTGQTRSSGVLVISEISRQTNPRWIELSSLSPSVDLSRFELTDMDGSTVAIAPKQATLGAGDKARVTFGSGTSESDQSGDRNGNGYLDLYRSNASSFALADTSDQLVAQSTDGETVDAVVYRESPGQGIPAPEQSDVNYLVSINQWDNSDSRAHLNTYTRDQLSRNGYLARKERMPGSFSDDNGKSDWRVTARPTPGSQNNSLRAGAVQVSDVPVRPDEYFRRTARTLDGSISLKNTNQHRLTMEFNQNPVNDTGFVVWYDTDAEPTGFSSPGTADSAVVSSGYDPDLKRLRTSVPLDGLSEGDEVRLLVSAIPDPGNPSSLDETVFDRSNRGYRFRVDEASPEQPGDLTLSDRTQDGLKLAWDPIATVPDDFREYRIYYDTGTVTESSRFFGKSSIDSLGKASLGLAEVPVSVVSDSWNFRIGAVDKTGNGGGFGSPGAGNLSDTLTKRRFESIDVQDLFLDPGNKSAGDTARMPRDTVTVRVVFDRSASSPDLVWDSNDTGTLPGSGNAGDTVVTMNHVAGGEYRAKIPLAEHGELIQFVFETDGGKLTNDGKSYRYRVDGRATPTLSNFRADTIQVTNFESATTDLSVGWDVLPESVTDFSHYLVAYSKGDTVSRTSSTVGPDKFEHLSDRVIGSATVRGLDRAETYTLGVYWVDQVGNTSLLSDTDRIQTVDAQPTEDPAFDGEFYATKLDGTEYLRKGDIRIEFEFSQAPAYPGRVSMKYNIGAEPGEDGTRELSMERVSETVYRAWIPEDQRMEQDRAVNYYIQEGPWQIRPSEGVFSFLIDTTPPPQLSGVSLTDNGDMFGIFWNPLSNGDDFSEYRIRYRQPGDDQWTVYDGDDDSSLTDHNTGSLYIEGIDPGANYYVNISPVDEMGRTTYRDSASKLQRTANFTPVLEVEPEYIKLHTNETGELEVYLEDLNGDPWDNRQVVWNKVGGPGTFDNGTGDSTLETTTNDNGRTTVTFSAGSQDRTFTHFKLTFPDAPAVDPVTVGLYTIPPDRDKSDYSLFTN